ncbi:Ubiquitin family protein [Trichomonas vaginalis G3]|uniref:Ubiquitin family protein n=1 Tax=Trichomonas vaginalis (strain ATCC PRA-98 / G3) TaxID=412133 RepID=A2ECR8_TRIV3|nr:cellular macromolecule catabolic process [Trichomonas vaginalis G3]EAY09564.1 Ubiquitin family protein [Trichomonas vaginalis G3]KAI5533193.1 cellular macromolecule catabolic process [Trichomonas vaginalis G3]|eukprot:XP_001321787.1 Ubiquitin family protein [Trichomonas vaginalis G3]
MSITIKVQTLSGISRYIKVEQTDTIEKIKSQLYSMDGIAPDQQRILYKGLALPDTATIESSGIKNDETVHMVISLKGGM